MTLTMKDVNIKPKVAIIYARVSSQEQVLGFSLDNQERQCRECATRTEDEVLRVFREEGESAKTADRTELQLMMRFCEKNKGKIGKLIVYKVDRLSRKTADYLYLKLFFNKLGISVVSATEHLEDTPSGILNETILSAFAQFDNDVRSQRTVDGMKARLESGLWSTIAPWGYINTVDATGKKIIIPHPKKAPIVKMLFEEYATGKYTFRELARGVCKLNVRSLHTTFRKQLVAKIIKNPIYYGWINFPKFGISLKGQHEPIISYELFLAAQAAKNKSLSKKLPRNKDNEFFPLRGVKCSGCSKSITGGRTKGKYNYYNYYGCYCSECSKRGAIKKEEFEKDFTIFLEELTPNEEVFSILKEAISIAHKKEFESVTSTKRKLESEIEEKINKKDKLLDLRVAGKISDDDFMPANEKVKMEITELKRSVSSISSPGTELDSVINFGLDFLRDLPKNWRSLEVKDLRVLRGLLFPENIEYMYPGFKTPELSLIYKLKSEFVGNKNPYVTLKNLDSKPLVEFLSSLSKIIKNKENDQVSRYSSVSETYKLSP